MNDHTIIYLTVCVLEELTVQTLPNILPAQNSSDQRGQVKQVSTDQLKVAREIRLPFFVRDLHFPGMRLELFNKDIVYQYALKGGTPMTVREDNDKVVKLIQEAIVHYSKLTTHSHDHCLCNPDLN